jgi:hypothetical protein
MASSPRAPDNSAQVQAAQKQEAELARQRSEAEAKSKQLATSSTEKLKGLRRKQAGRGTLMLPENTYIPAGPPTPVKVVRRDPRTGSLTEGDRLASREEDRQRLTAGKPLYK